MNNRQLEWNKYLKLKKQHNKYDSPKFKARAKSEFKEVELKVCDLNKDYN
eukprot:CAMPEP_0116940336 /NCGR_PEP_ID=MMETSP0467-20121206/33304_1 /TAXON_ID=283647 /ORGANISM="Mesodinium pulex, Strain SPMC105" /LENGTH=49 /DNA_ID=CAMNT_0004622853 /DNA_START=889 /DNA_END=1038 /DNA_ORIENTATION=-